MGEHHVRNVGVVGSNPMPSTKIHPIQSVYCDPPLPCPVGIALVIKSATS